MLAPFATFGCVNHTAAIAKRATQGCALGARQVADAGQTRGTEVIGHGRPASQLAEHARRPGEQQQRTDQQRTDH